MRADLLRVLKTANPRGWKKVKIEFTGGPLVVSVPPDCVEMSMKKAGILKDPAKEIERALDEPCGGRSLEEIVRSKTKLPGELKVAITVSDITRPVPYRGKKGVLFPLLKKLQAQGIRRSNILIIVGTGTHRASTPKEKIEMLGKEVSSAYKIHDHDCEDQSSLALVGTTPAGTDVFLNRCFHEADLEIATGLTESHVGVRINRLKKIFTQSYCGG